jgi:hypothetical protein
MASCEQSASPAKKGNCIVCGEPRPMKDGHEVQLPFCWDVHPEGLSCSEMCRVLGGLPERKA